jgi:Tol biopolymer transport system component
MKRLATTLAIFAGSSSLAAQAPAPTQVQIANALPGPLRATQIAMSPDTKRVYYGDSTRALWFYDRTDNRNIRLADGEAFDLNLSPNGDALAFTKSSAGSADHHVWILPLDPTTGAAAGPMRRAGTSQGDTPVISPDGKWLAFAADDSSGVGQSVVVVSMTGGRERVVAPSLRTAIGGIRWAPDGKSLLYGVNPPVACNPDWSCLPLKPEFNQTTGTLRRVSVSGGAPTVLAAKTGNGWPGLSADGSLLAYSDTGFSGRLVVADSNGNTIRSLPLIRGQTVEGWLSGATLVLSDRGEIRRVRAYSVADGSARTVVDSLDQIIEPTYSPDGQSIEMMRCGPERCDLRINRIDRTLYKVIPLPDRYTGGNAWSPDQKWISYIGNLPSGERHAAVVEVATGRVVPLTTFRAATAAMLWLPDSRGILLSTTAGTGAARKMTVQRLDLDGTSHILRDVAVGPTPSGGNAVSGKDAIVLRGSAWTHLALSGDSVETPILAAPGRYSGFMATSPDLGRVAFRRSRDANDQEFTVVEVINADGTNRNTIDVPFFILGGPGALRLMPGGKQVVVMGVTNGEPGVSVYLVDVEPKATKRLFTIPPRAFTGDLTISADGRTILYVVNDNAAPRIYTMDLSSLRPTSR